MSVNKRSKTRVQGSWATAGPQQKLRTKPDTNLVSASDVNRPMFLPSERVNSVQS